MKKSKRVISTALSLLLLWALALPARAEGPEVDIVWLPEGVTPLDASLWSITGESSLVTVLRMQIGEKTPWRIVMSLAPVREAQKGDLIAVERDGKYGYMDLNGELVVPFVDTSTSAAWYFFYSDGVLPVLQRDENGKLIKICYVDRKGNTAIELENGFFGFAFQDGVALVQGENSWGESKYGAIDTKGNVVIPYEYDYFWDDYGLGFVGGFAILGKRTSEGAQENFFVSSDGKIVISLSDYEDARPFSEGMAAVEQDGKWGYINTTGELKVPCEYESVENFQNGFAVVCKDGKYGYINTSGKEITDIQFDRAFGFGTEGYGRVELNGEGSYVDKTGKGTEPTFSYTVPQTLVDSLSAEGYEVGSTLRDDRVMISRDGKAGYADSKGNVVIPLEYDTVSSRFTAGLSLVRRGDKFGYINTQGEVVGTLESESSSYIGLIMGGYVGVVYQNGRYGIFENPYYEEPKAQTPSLSGLLSSGSSVSPGDTVASFPLLPVFGALAVVVGGGGALLLLKKKKS